MAHAPVSLSKARLDVEGLVLPNGLRVAHATAEGENLSQADEAPFVKGSGPVHLSLEINQQDLQAFLATQAPAELSGMSLQVTPAGIGVAGVFRAMLPLPFTALCQLEIVGGQKMFVRLSSIQVMGLSPSSLVQAQLDKINPVFDASELPVNLTLKGAELKMGSIHVTGELNLSQ
ncbi:MAG: LmeA family phospholipid-binding protein [Armatimonadetes bacterium]|nr:LmeA family phospholipid-binding protein [Armatimonadota bacterium]